MASPQLENGYTPISNELYEQLLLFNFPSPSPLKIMLFLIRKIYGFQKTEDYISLTQISEKTNLSRQTVVSSIEWLCNSNMVLKVKFSQKGTMYKIQKDYEKWVVNAPRLVKAGRLLVVYAPRPQVVNAPRHTKENINKYKINSVTNVTSPLILTKTFMDEIEYISLDEKPVKGKYGNKVMAVLARCYLKTAGIEVGTTFDASKYAKGLSKIYQECGKDADEAMRHIQVAGEYFNSKGLSWTPEAVWRDWELIEGWKSKDKQKVLEKMSEKDRILAILDNKI